jgi:hypothetical protein
VILAVVLLQANGGSAVGASDPQGAVNGLAKAIDNQDVIAGLAAVAPEESAAATDLLRALISKAQANNLIASKDKPLAGLTTKVQGLQLEVTQIHPLVARVNVNGGVLSYAFDPAQLAAPLRDDLGDSVQHAAGSFSADQAKSGIDNYNQQHDHHLSGAFLMTVKRNGRWFVSLFYTVAEYLRQAAGLPAANYDATTGSLKSGAATPDDAIKGILTGTLTDPVPMLGFLPPDTFRVVYDYMDSIKSALGKFNVPSGASAGSGGRFDFHLVDLHTTAQSTGTNTAQLFIDSATFTMTVTSTADFGACPPTSGPPTASGSGGLSGQACVAPASLRSDTATVTDKITIKITGTCASITGVTTSTGPQHPGPQHPGPQHHATSACLSKAAPGLKLDKFFLMTIRERGGWYLDPLGTIAGYLKLIVHQASPADIECLLRKGNDPSQDRPATKKACAKSTLFGKA